MTAELYAAAFLAAAALALWLPSRIDARRKRKAAEARAREDEAIALANAVQANLDARWY